ncbi:hypothetical protein WR25_03746 [Diploscapter pachys]|uniref:Metallo-beta-lactamase domain-containing protein n=1 Tax=Diploscapter pachys TaxID=2018661 RepID=A0A2A2LP00_9BILA|nr:hypothetical protein WR25_03746 [Diploscapter pachys]
MSNALFPTLHSFIQFSKESKLDSIQTFAENTQKDMADVKSKFPLNMSKMSTAKTKKNNVSSQTRTALPPLPNGRDRVLRERTVDRMRLERDEFERKQIKLMEIARNFQSNGESDENRRKVASQRLLSTISSIASINLGISKKKKKKKKKALVTASEAATTEQLRQWILANRRSMTGDVEGGDFASAILRLFGFGPEQRSTTTPATTTTTTQQTTTTLNMDVCPFAAEPLILNNGYAFCRPSSIGDCPVEYLCDQSTVLGRSICCRDQGKPHIAPNRPAVSPGNRVSSFSWNTVTPRPGDTWKQTGLQSTTRKTPWYIKDRTGWPTMPNRPAVSKEITVPSPQPTAVPLTYAPETVETTTQEKENPWGKLWTTSAPKNRVNVSVLQAGSVRSLKDGQMEAVGAITLLNDNGHVILVDTGSASDTERLLHKFIPLCAKGSLPLLFISSMCSSKADNQIES